MVMYTIYLFHYSQQRVTLPLPSPVLCGEKFVLVTDCPVCTLYGKSGVLNVLGNNEI